MSIRAIGLLTALLSIAAPSAAQRSTQEMRDLPPREVKRMLRDDLLSILAIPGEVTRGNRRQMHDTAIPTRPVGSGIKGLCQRDLLLLYYAPARDASEQPPVRHGLSTPVRERLEDVPMLPYGIEAERFYYFTDRPEAEKRDEAHPFHPRFAEDCGASSTSLWEGWFTAPSAQDAVAGALVVGAAAKAVESRRVSLSGCDEESVERAKHCRADLARVAADPKTFDAIRTCPTEAGQLCYSIEAGGTVLTIVIRLSGKAVSPDSVVSVRHEENIIVT